MTEFKATNFIFTEKLGIRIGGVFCLSDFFALHKGPEAAERLTNHEFLSAKTFFFLLHLQLLST